MLRTAQLTMSVPAVQAQAVVLFDMRCVHCRHLILKIGQGPLTRIEVRCSSCNTMNVWGGTG